MKIEDNQRANGKITKEKVIVGQAVGAVLLLQPLVFWEELVSLLNNLQIMEPKL